ncbi:hypothetical protein ACFOD1_07705 [Pseudidiomarina halophila]|uniref:Uncharacterized protein n=1 Tax=Pseudidiomarina halophila TaxID=1449799 RepID=A0A432XRI7_9GAMM|nr:hypothetical protein [Pseudidiomarina halophila]RUO51345.1 hypothetical protein CWI69_11710 [Pseudidiomarina halophila]
MNDATKSSTADSSAQLWNNSQLEALAALNLPQWHKTAVTTAEASAGETTYFYKLQDWILSCPVPIPVTVQSWHRDVFRTLAPDSQQRPTEISASIAERTEGVKFLELPELTMPELDAAQKRDLWLRICNSDD